MIWRQQGKRLLDGRHALREHLASRLGKRDCAGRPYTTNCGADGVLAPSQVNDIDVRKEGVENDSEANVRYKD
jgi:hypothetical protein